MSNNISLLDFVEQALTTEVSNEKFKNFQSRKRDNKKPKKKKEKLLFSWRTTLENVNDVVDISTSSNGEKHYLTTKLKTALGQLIEQVDKVEIARSEKNTSGIVFGKVSITKIISEYWSPVFNESIPESSHANWYLQHYGTSMSLSFADHVQKFDGLNEYADLILEARDAIEVYEGDDIPNLMYQIECLDVTASIIEAVVKAFDKYCWCEMCFRRTADNRKYCREHKRNEHLGPGINSRGELIKSRLTRQTFTLFNLYQDRRNLLGDSVHVLSRPEQIPYETSSEWRSISFSTPICVFEDIGDIRYWENRKSQWDELFESMPFLKEKLKTIPSGFSSWELFSSALLSAIQDNDEKTKHPLWILHIAILAERWFEAESKIVDRRRTDTNVSINKFLNEGIRQSEIAKQLGITPAAVSKAIKQMKQNERC